MDCVMALHEQCVGATDEWYTPKHVFDALDCWFDVDVASPGQKITPWIPAHSFIMSCSLSISWSGFVFMNPPFGGRNGLVPWLEKFIKHSNGICLVPDRTSAPWWQAWAAKMNLILFVTPKLKFIDRDGLPGMSPAQGTCLGGIGQAACMALRRAQANGLGILLRAA
jgi:hypothetical protein